MKTEVMRCWELAKNLNNSEKFELSLMLMESIKTAFVEPKKDDDFDVEEYERNLRPYTMDEINAMLDEAEARIDAGSYVTNEDFFREWDEEIARAEQLEEEQQLEMAVAV